MQKTASAQQSILALYSSFASGGIGRREFMRRSAALGIAGAATSALGMLAASPGEAAVRQAADAAALEAPIDLAEWSYFWVGVRRAKLARGTVVNGEQMYVEYWVPAQVRHPYPMVIVHGGGGQGLDWFGRPDGGPGWVSYLLQRATRSTWSIGRGMDAHRSIPSSMAPSHGVRVRSRVWSSGSRHRRRPPTHMVPRRFYTRNGQGPPV